MGGIWPFKKKAAEAEGQKVVTYSKDDHHAEDIMSDKSHIEGEQYQSALDLLTTPHLGKESAGEVVKTEVVDNQQKEGSGDSIDSVSGEVPKGEYVQSSDGYWYLKKDDGSFDPTAHVEAEDGSFSPYSE